MEELINQINIIITCIQNDHKLLLKKLKHEYSFSNVIFPRSSTDYANYFTEKFPVQFLQNDKRNITVIFYKEHKELKILRVEIMLKNETTDILNKLCINYHLKKRKKYESENVKNKCIEKCYILEKEVPDSWNIILTIFIEENSDGQASILHIFEKDKSDNFQFIFTLPHTL